MKVGGLLYQSGMDNRSKQKVSRLFRHSIMPPPPYCKKGDKTGTESARQSLAQLRLEVTDIGELLHLCAVLNDGDTCTLESKINKYVSRNLNLLILIHILIFLYFLYLEGKKNF